MAPRWTANETAALRIGVDRYGKGKWKVIREHFNEILGSRSGEELKDAWRRITNKHDDTAAALANAYQVLGIDPPPAAPLVVGPVAGPLAAGPVAGPLAAGPIVGPPAAGPLAAGPIVGPPAAGPLVGPPSAGPLVIVGPPAAGPPSAGPLVGPAPVGDAPSPKDVDDDEDKKFEVNYGKSLKCKDSFETGYFYSGGIWCKYKKETQDLLRVAFKEDAPLVKQELSRNRVRLIFLYRMTEYRLWKEVGAKARPMGWMDTSGEMHFPDHLDRSTFTVVLKDGEETFVSTPKLMTALKNELKLGNMNSEMSKLACKALGHYEELYTENEGAFVDAFDGYADNEFVTFLGTLV